MNKKQLLVLCHNKKTINIYPNNFNIFTLEYAFLRLELHHLVSGHTYKIKSVLKACHIKILYNSFKKNSIAEHPTNFYCSQLENTDFI